MVTEGALSRWMKRVKTSWAGLKQPRRCQDRTLSLEWLEARQAPAATITGLSPSTGLTAGGAMVTISGSSLANATEVDFGTTRAQINSYNAATQQLLVTSPGGPVGTVDIIVKTPDGDSMPTPDDHFTYVLGPPILTVAAPGGAYNGKSFQATATATTAGGATVAGSLAFTYTDSHNHSSSIAPSNAGAYSVVVRFISSDSSYTNTQSDPISFTITPVPLTVTGITAGSKVYNGNTAATLNLTGARLVGVLSGDAVTLNTSKVSGAFPSKNVGSNLVVTVSGLKLTGAQAADYVLTQPTTTASITPLALTVSATGQNKFYDGTTRATVTLTDNRVPGDQLSDNFTTASFPGKNVTATAQMVSVSGISISGPDAANYTCNTTATTTASITPAPLTVTGITASDKVYDGRTRASLKVTNAQLQGVIKGDSVTLNTSKVSGVFASRDAGTALAVIVSGLSLSGPAATLANYTLIQPTLQARIIPATLTVTDITAGNKVYDGTPLANLNVAKAVLHGVVNGDSVSLNTTHAGGAFATRNVGSGISVTVTGLSLSGPTATLGDYVLTPPTTTANITPRPITVTAAASTKIYDGTTASTQKPTITAGTLAPGDTANFIQTFSTRNAGSGKTLIPSGSVQDGNNGKNYRVTFKNSKQGEIDKALLTLQASNITLFLGQPRPALTYSLSGLVAGDSRSVVSGSPVLTTPATSHSSPGTYPISISRGSLSAANYQFQFVNGTLTVASFPPP